MNIKDNLSQTFSLAENTTDKMWEMWLVTLGSFSWTQDQIDSILKKYLDQRKIAREESIKIAEELISQAKKNQSQMQNMIQDAVILAFENAKFPNANYMNDLSNKVDELSKKVDNLK